VLRTAIVGLLDLLAPTCCPACTLPLELESSEASFCAACGPLVELAPARMRPPETNAAIVEFAGPAADAIRHFKYAGDLASARPLTRLLVAGALAYAGSVDAVVPMPLHPNKLRARGWNPSLVLARPVARALGVPLRPRWLTRTRATRTQAGLSSAERLRNVYGAFRARSVPGCRVLLIDDVRTTGATLAEAARELQTRGHSVVTLALAWAPDGMDPIPGALRTAV
jgi:ComF family protein